MNIELIETNDDLKEIALNLIKNFWKEHNNIIQNLEETKEDYENWRKEGHRLFLIVFDAKYIGFAHIGSRGADIDWLEDLYIIDEYQNKGIGSKVISELESLVKTYSDCLYIEVSSTNLNALRLYQRLGYNTLNTITIRKDFNEENFDVLKEEVISEFKFKIKEYR